MNFLQLQKSCFGNFIPEPVGGFSKKDGHTSFSRRRARVGKIGARRAPDNLGVSHAWIMGNLANAPHLALRRFA